MDTGSNFNFYRITSLLIPISVLTTIGGIASAANITFETTQGYSTTGGTGGGGNLTGQPAGTGVTQWQLTNTNRSAIRVTADANGNQAATTFPNTSSTGDQTYKLTENNNLDYAFSNTSSKVAFSLDLRLNAAAVDPTSSGAAALLRPRLTSTVGQNNSTPNYVSGFEFENSGSFAFNYNTTSPGVGASGTHYATVAGTSSTSRTAANNFYAAYSAASGGTFFTINGVADFSTGTFTLYVNGVQQQAGTTMYFDSSPTNFTDLYVDVATLFNAGATTVSSSFDNLIVVAPEPATLSMLAFAGFGLLHRRRRSSCDRVA